MAHEQVFAAVDANVPCAHMEWPRDEAPPLPWAVYYLERDDGFFADDSIYAPCGSWVVELYQKSRDRELEESLESSLREAFHAFTKTEAWVAEEDCLQTTYRFSTLD